MIVVLYSMAQQDTVRVKNQALTDSAILKQHLKSPEQKQTSDSSVKTPKQLSHATGRLTATAVSQLIVPVDTTSVCRRNSIADISFYIPDNFISSGKLDPVNRFPFEFTEKNRKSEAARKEILVKQLKPGQDLQVQAMHEDWIIINLAIVLFLFSLVRSTSKSLLPDVSRFLLFRTMSNLSKSKSTGLALWQSILLNLIAFNIISLFLYCTASFFQMLPAGFSRLLVWLIILAGIMITAGLRYIICFMTGQMSGTEGLFREYLSGVSQSYRYSALFLYLLIILICYTLFFPANVGFMTGGIIMGVLYLVRVIRLFIIFLNSSVSIFYLILYLCALEILPVLIVLKYISGLV
jgi:hypothetical protein